MNFKIYHKDGALEVITDNLGIQYIPLLLDIGTILNYEYKKVKKGNMKINEFERKLKKGHIMKVNNDYCEIKPIGVHVFFSNEDLGRLEKQIPENLDEQLSVINNQLKALNIQNIDIKTLIEKQSEFNFNVEPLAYLYKMGRDIVDYAKEKDLNTLKTYSELAV